MATTRRRAVLAAAVMTAASVLVGCSDDVPAPGENVTVEDIAEADVQEIGEDEDGLSGRTVTVVGQVVEIVDPGAFLVGDVGVFEPSVLVLSPTADFVDQGVEITDLLVEEATVVEVTGTVRQLSLGEFQEDYPIPYDEYIFDEFAGEGVIVADTVVIDVEVLE